MATQKLLKAIPKKNDLAGRWIVGSLLVIYAIVFVGGLSWRLLAPIPSPNSSALASWRQINESLVMMFAGGVGATVYAVRAFLLHACAKKDFENHYIPWYVFRSLQGILLAFLFYFVLKGGIIVLAVSDAPLVSPPAATEESQQAREDSPPGATDESAPEATEEPPQGAFDAAPQAPENLNIWMLAGTGALVGLFSKYAIARLREVFIVAFGGREKLEKEEETEDVV
jgi:hypothetical protein